MRTTPTGSKLRVFFLTYVFIIITTYTLYIIHITKTDCDDGFYSYVLNKGISINKVSAGVYRISDMKWNCIIDTSVAKNFRKLNLSWKDLFETRISVLSNKTIFTPQQLRKKIGVLPKDGTPITLIARQGNMSVPERNVIIRVNRHGPLDARTTMIITWAHHIETVTMCARNKPNDEIIRWIFNKTTRKPTDNDLWNTSQPLVIPEKVWNLKNLIYYRGPLFFLKGDYFIHFGNFAKNDVKDFIGLGALYQIVHLKGYVTTLGFSTIPDSYNLKSKARFQNLAHKLAFAYYVVEELTDTRNLSRELEDMTHIRRAELFSNIFLNLGTGFIYLIVIVVLCVLFKQLNIDNN